MGQTPDGKPTWIVIRYDRMDNGDVEVTYSFAPSYHYVAQVRPGVDAANGIRITGDVMYKQYLERGYV